MSGQPRAVVRRSRSGGAMSASRGGILIGAAVVVGILIFSVINRGGPSGTTATTTVTEPTTVTVPATNADGTAVTTGDSTTETTKAKKNSKTARGPTTRSSCRCSTAPACRAPRPSGPTT